MININININVFFLFFVLLIAFAIYKYSQIKNNYEVGEIINMTNLTEHSIILDIGCGTGHHVGLLENKGYNAIGIDESSSMISKAKNNYPESDFRVANVLNSNIFNYQTFTHILCLYFTIYYVENKYKVIIHLFLDI